MALEILSYYSAPCCDAVNSKWNDAEKCSRSPNFENHRVLCAKVGSKNRSMAVRSLGRSSMVNLRSQEGVSWSFDSLKGPRHFDSQICRVSYDDGYVMDGEEAKNMSGTDKAPTKLIIPGLPDESNGESGASISSCFWEWKPKLNVHYEKAGFENVNSPNVLFLPGFGAGSFHYEKQLKDLGREYRVWAVDFLGQGMSLPYEDPTPSRREVVSGPHVKSSSWGFGDETETWASELAYSIDLWRDQVCYFIEEVIGEPVYVVGNSLGGYVALYFAASYPHLVKGVTLLNATPFWGFLPNPVRSPRLAKIFPWAGKFPLPSNVRRLTELVWQKISDPRSIAEVLKQVYADHSTKVDDVFSRIVETTRHPAAAASFASIMFAPQGELSFTESLSRCQEHNVRICLMYGKEDPWVRPVWGRKVKQQVPEAPYYEISPAGHCPHDEVPEVVNFLLRGWIKNLETRGSIGLPLLEDLNETKKNTTAKELEFTRGGSKKSVTVKIFGSNLSLWDLVRSYISTQLGKVATKIP